MGYTTDFTGKFKLNKKLDAETHEFLNKLASTRRMARNIDGYGVDGEFYVDGGGDYGQGYDDNIIDHNSPPRSQPGLWCQWVPSDDGLSIAWDGGEKFYEYVAWIEYIIAKVLKPKGYKLTGVVKWYGEDISDIGAIEITDNKVKVLQGEIKYKNVKAKGKR